MIEVADQVLPVSAEVSGRRRACHRRSAGDGVGARVRDAALYL